MLELFDYFLSIQDKDLNFYLTHSITNIPLDGKNKVLFCFIGEKTDDGMMLSSCALLPEEAYNFELYSYNKSTNALPMITIIKKESIHTIHSEFYTLEKENIALRKIIEKIIKTNTTPLRLYEQFEKFQEECKKTLEKMDNLKKDSSYQQGFNSLKEYFNI